MVERNSAPVTRTCCSGNPNAVYNQDLAASVLTLPSPPISEYTPLQIKQTLTGYGKAEKKQIQEMVRIQLGMTCTPKPDDCADALATAITHYLMTRV